MIKPLYNFIKKKTSKRQKEVSPPPRTYPIPVAPSRETESVGFDSDPAPEKKQQGFNKNVVVGTIVVAGLLVVLMFGSKQKRENNQAKDEETVFIKENARYEMEKQSYETERAQLLSDFQSLSSQRNDILGRLKKNYDMATNNAEDFKDMFADKKGDYAGSDNADSLNTAFMLKEDLESKKQGMIKEAKALGEEKKQLVQAMMENQESINYIADTYNASYDGEKLPRAEF